MNFAIIPRSWAPALHSVLRLMTGLLFLEHGSAKLLGFPAVQIPEMPTALLIVTGLLELVGGALIAVGFLTRPVAFLLSGFMAVAYFIAHFPRTFYPMANGGEAAILFCFIFLFLAAAGAGPYAVDKD